MCKSASADKTGSHIVPHFILKRIENIEGKTARGYEIGFKITEIDVDSYFGSSVLPDRLKTVFGEINDEDIENNKHPLVVDYIFCSGCESRLAILESIYSQVLFAVTPTPIPSEIGILFWMSVFWRLSICDSFSFTMTTEENEVCRRILNRSLKIKAEALDIPAMRHYSDSRKVSYKIIQCSNYSMSYPTSLHIVPNIRKPYVLLIDEIIVCFSLKSKYHDPKAINLWGILHDLSTYHINTVNSNEKKVQLTEGEITNIYSELADIMAAKRLAFISEYLDALHIAADGKGKEMYPYLKQEIMAEIANGEQVLGQRYTNDHIKKSAISVFKRNGLL